eukprot:m51a1_g3100 hypothetical protein (109) ;mRNA; r:119909-120235
MPSGGACCSSSCASGLLPGTEPATITHIRAELLMGVACVLGSAAALCGLRCGPQVSTFGAGMAAYASFNALDWAENNEPRLLLPMYSSILFAWAVPVVLSLTHHEAKL